MQARGAAAAAAGCSTAAACMLQPRAAAVHEPAAPALRWRPRRPVPPALALSLRHAERGEERDKERAARTSQPGPDAAQPWEGLPLEAHEGDVSHTHVSLAAPSGGGAIHLFGVIHGGNESEVAEFIMRQRPSVVVVETSLNAAHGAAHGNTIRRADCLNFAHAAAPGSHEQRARVFAQYGVQLADMAHPLGSHLWQDLSQVRGGAGAAPPCVLLRALCSRSVWGATSSQHLLRGVRLGAQHVPVRGRLLLSRAAQHAKSRCCDALCTPPRGRQCRVRTPAGAPRSSGAGRGAPPPKVLLAAAAAPVPAGQSRALQ